MNPDPDPAATTVASPERAPSGEQIATILRPGQFVAGQQHAVPRARLSRRARAALWVLRILVIVTAAMVIYTFFAHLRP
jgi:hypothetical protein